jgi:hypothetical protein
MNLTSKHVIAILKNKVLKKELLAGEQITEDEFRNYDFLEGEKKELATSEVMYVMHHGFADTIAYYSDPLEQGIDPIVIYGERGIYLVHEREPDFFTFFTNKNEATAYANQQYDAWIDLFDEL